MRVPLVVLSFVAACFFSSCSGTSTNTSTDTDNKIVVVNTGEDHIVFDFLYFSDGESEIRKNQTWVAEQLAQDLQRVQRIRLLAVIGYARRGENMADEVSAFRAMAVVEALVKQGVARSRLVPYAAGDRVLRDEGAGPEADAKNRSVGFQVLDDELLGEEALGEEYRHIGPEKTE
jgi:outer membrane protein OmpA-like peptidoglycan-associated protein